MPKNYQLSIHIQLPGQQQVEAGVHITPDYVLGTDIESGLMALAVSDSGNEQPAAAKALEILLDDMNTNLSATLTGVGRANPGTFIAGCLQESLDNINEFLHFQLSKTRVSTQDAYTSLATIQYFEGYFGYICMAGFSCLLFRQGKLEVLDRTSKDTPCLLGENPAFEGQVHSKAVEEGDILIVARTRDIEIFGMDYLRTTLSRFPDSIDTVMRQINTRAARIHSSQQLGMVIARVEEQLAPKRSWLGKLGVR